MKVVEDPEELLLALLPIDWELVGPEVGAQDLLLRHRHAVSSYPNEPGATIDDGGVIDKRSSMI
jgi:hypothetical protein